MATAARLRAPQVQLAALEAYRSSDTWRLLVALCNRGMKSRDGTERFCRIRRNRRSTSRIGIGVLRGDRWLRGIGHGPYRPAQRKGRFDPALGLPIKRHQVGALLVLFRSTPHIPGRQQKFRCRHATTQLSQPPPTSQPIRLPKSDSSALACRCHSLRKGTGCGQRCRKTSRVLLSPPPYDHPFSPGMMLSRQSELARTSACTAGTLGSDMWALGKRGLQARNFCRVHM